jgi:Cu/Ag efflux protein CusF
MSKRILPIVMLALAICSAAEAQSGGGGGGGGGRRGGGGGGKGGRAPSSQAPAQKTEAAPVTAPTPVDQVEIVGVVKALGPEPGQVTIAYDAVDALNWPPGTSPFALGKPELLNGVTVGEKVRFRLESHKISQLSAF